MKIISNSCRAWLPAVTLLFFMSGAASAGGINWPKCGGSICGAIQKGKQAVIDAGGDLEKTVRTGKCGGDLCNAWERNVKPAGEKAGAVWDRAAKPVGKYIGAHPLEAAIIAATIAYGGYALIAANPEVTFSIVVESSPGVYTTVPIITVSSTTAGTSSLVVGGAGILNAATTQTNSKSGTVTDKQLADAQKFRDDMAKTEPATLAEDGNLYERYFHTAKYGRTPESSVFALSFPLEALSPGHKSSKQLMKTVYLGAPIKDHGGDILPTGDFMNLRPPGAKSPITGSDVKRLHAAYDIAAQPGTTVYAPMTGKIVAVAEPYGTEHYTKSAQMLGLTIRSDTGVEAQIFYVNPSTEIVGALTNHRAGSLQVFAGTSVIGTAQDVHTFYVERKSTEPPVNHVHLQFKDDHGRALDLGGAKVVTGKGGAS